MTGMSAVPGLIVPGGFVPGAPQSSGSTGSLTITAQTVSEPSAGGLSSVTSVSFSPGANSLVRIIITWAYSTGGSGRTFTCADSNAVSYTQTLAGSDSGFGTYLAIFDHQYTTAPGSITVTVTASNTSFSSPMLQPYVITGHATNQSSAATASHQSTGGTANETSITPTALNSVVFAAGSGPYSSSGNTMTPVGISDTVQYQAAGTGTGQAIGLTAATSSLTSETVGWTFASVPGATLSIIAAEVLPAGSVTTWNGALTAAATASASFSGTKTAKGVLTTNATAHAAIAGTKTAQGVLTAAATAHAAFVAKRTQFGNLLAAVTAYAAFIGTRTAKGILAAAATALAAFNGTHSSVRNPMPLGGTLAVYTVDGTDTEVANLAGTLTQNLYGGTNTQVANNLGGALTVTANLLGGSISAYTDDGSIAMTAFGGSATGWTMQNINLNFAEFNDITLTGTITNNGSALNLTGYTVNMYLKPTAGVVDTDGRVIKLSSGGGSPAITITNASSGAISVFVANADLQDQTHTFYRIDAVDTSSHINTAIYGNITYTSL